MAAIGALAPKPATAARMAAERRQQTQDRLTFWAEHLREHNHGHGHPVLTRAEIVRAIDLNLDLLLDLDPNLKPCHLPADTTVWCCDWCGQDVSGVEPTDCTSPRHDRPTSGTPVA